MAFAGEVLARTLWTAVVWYACAALLAWVSPLTVFEAWIFWLSADVIGRNARETMAKSREQRSIEDALARIRSSRRKVA